MSKWNPQNWDVFNGNKSSGQDFADNFLSPQEFANLRPGDKFDHRDSYGMFAEAVVLKKRRNGVNIKYESYGDEYNTSANYERDPLSFAKYQSISTLKATSELKNMKTGEIISFKPAANDPNCGWTRAQIVKCTKRSGQVRVQYENSTGKIVQKWTHLDNYAEVRALTDDNNSTYQSQQAQQSQQWQHSTGFNNNNGNYSRQTQKMRNNGGNKVYGNGYHDHHNHNTQQCCNDDDNNNYGNRRMYQQKQVQRQDQMTVRTQLLLDDTHKQIVLTRNYLEAVGKQQCSADELSIYNQKVVIGLTCFKMKVDGMRKNAKKEGLSFDDAFKSSAMIIKQFENEFKSTFGNNEYLMKRLDPCLNYMRAVLKGVKNIPPLPYVNSYEFNENIASSVISQVNHAQNHVIPDRMNDVNKNSKHYKEQQAQLKQKYESGQYEDNDKVSEVTFNDLIQDYNSTNIKFADDKETQDARNRRDTEQAQFAGPNLMDLDDY